MDAAAIRAIAEDRLRALGCTCAVEVEVVEWPDVGGLPAIRTSHEQTCALILRTQSPWN